MERLEEGSRELLSAASGRGDAAAEASTGHAPGAGRGSSTVPLFCCSCLGPLRCLTSMHFILALEWECVITLPRNSLGHGRSAALGLGQELNGVSSREEWQESAVALYSLMLRRGGLADACLRAGAVALHSLMLGSKTC